MITQNNFLCITHIGDMLNVDKKMCGKNYCRAVGKTAYAFRKAVFVSCIFVEDRVKLRYCGSTTLNTPWASSEALISFQPVASFTSSLLA